jgi:hypothetical protein
MSWRVNEEVLLGCESDTRQNQKGSGFVSLAITKTPLIVGGLVVEKSVVACRKSLLSGRERETCNTEKWLAFCEPDDHETI